MRRFVVMLCAANWLFAVDAVADVQGTPAATAQVYDTLLQNRLDERRSAFIQLSGAEKSNVWAHHLLTALTEHPEFTKEQRDVIQYALSILTPAFAEMDPADPQWEQVVGKPLRELERRALAAFSPKQVLSLFAQLGPEQSAPTGAGAVPTDTSGASSGGRPKTRMAPLDVIVVPPCHCNTSAHYFCDSSGVGFYYCAGGGCWPTTSGCGWFWRAACNGLCRARSGGGDD